MVEAWLGGNRKIADVLAYTSGSSYTAGSSSVMMSTMIWLHNQLDEAPFHFQHLTRL